MPEPQLSMGSARGKLIVAATVLGSGVVFLEGTVVNVAMPAIAREFGLGIAGLQWVLDAYLLTLSALILTGGSLGDVYGRGRMFVLGLFAFGATSALAAFMPTATSLIMVRLLQGAAGAVMVPNSLAVLETVFGGPERARAIAQWAGWSAASTALGPLAGGWIIDATSWRWVFGVVAPVAFLGAAIGWRAIPPSKHSRRQARAALDLPGAGLATAALAGITTAFIVAPLRGFSDPLVLIAGVGGAIVMLAFVSYERRAPGAMLPVSMFASRDFIGTNVATFFIYAALAGVFFLLMLELQGVLGYSAFKAGSALLPINVLMVLLSPVSGRLAARFGARWFIAIGAAACAAGTLLLATVHTGVGFFTRVIPASAVFAFGLATLVAPLTATMMDSAGDELKGVASAFNNAVSRVAGLLATAIVPFLAGVAGATGVPTIGRGFAAAMMICAALCIAGGVSSVLLVGNSPQGAPASAA